MAAADAKGSPTPSVQDDEDMKGWLFKWTNYIKGYQKRWFVLSNGVLSYYRYLPTQFVTNPSVACELFANDESKPEGPHAKESLSIDVSYLKPISSPVTVSLIWLLFVWRVTIDYDSSVVPPVVLPLVKWLLFPNPLTFHGDRFYDGCKINRGEGH